MPQAIAPIIIAAAGLTGATAAAVTAAAAVATIALTASYQKKQEADARKAAASAPRDVMVRSAIEPSKIVYGRARVSGPVVYTNTKPTPGTNDNNTLWTVVSLASHECDDIEAIWLDGDEIPSAIIDWAGTGGVTSGTYGPISGNEVTNFYRRLGSDTQSHVSELASAFSDWTTSHVGKGTCYVVSAFELGTRTGEGVWSNGAPQSIRAVVKGKKVYDPRLDSTNGGSGTHRLADPTTWEWSDNPALCLADYLFDADLGMGAEGVSYSDIDWAMVATAANQCDATVTSPAGNQKRFTCNGVLDTGTPYADNIRNLLSSMAGTLTWSGGKYRIRAAAYEAPTFTFTENDIVGDVQVQPERPRAQRFNTVRGTFIDPSADYAATQFLRVQDSDYLSTRDDGQELATSIALPMTNDQYMAQRLAWRSLRLNNQQTTAVVPLNWKALKVGVGDRINLTVSELGWSAKVFVVDAWSFDPEKGFMLTVKEDSASAYTDPALGDYSTRTAAGTIVFNDPAVPSPSGLSATSEEEGILLEWEAPSMPSMYDEVVIYASADSAWANAVEVGRVRGTRFRHELTRGTTRYYWARSEDVDGRESIRDPDSDTSTVTATAGQIATSQLNDDADFAGAQLGDNLRDEDGTTILGKEDVKNNEITDLFLEDGTLLNDEGGNPITLNTLGDSAITVRSSLDGVEANYSVKVDLNGRVSGFGLIATAATATPFSAFAVIADKFAVVDPDSTGSNPIVPFEVSAGKATFSTDVEINGDLITTGTITATRLNLNGTMFTAPSGVLTIADGGVGSDQLASGAVDIAKFASGITPVQVVGTLPSTADQGDQAFLTTDKKLYRYNGTAWIKAVDGADVSSGTLPASAIVANSITAGQIQAGAIGATEISVTNLAAISADLGSITAGTIDASSVTVSNLNASNITAGSLNADRLSIDGVTLDTSGGNLIIANGGVDTSQVATAAITETSVATAADKTIASTTLIDTGLTITVTIPAGATILITVSFEYSVTGTASTNRADVLLYEDATALRNVAHSAGAESIRGVTTFVEAITNSTGSASTRTYKTMAKETNVLTTLFLTEQHITVTELKR